VPSKHYTLKKEAFILSTGDIITGKTAGSQRVMKIAKSLREEGIEVFICVLSNIKSDKIEPVALVPGISMLMSKEERVVKRTCMVNFLSYVAGYIHGRNTNSVIYLYPTTYVLKDFIYLIYFKYFNKIKFFCEINELRTAIATTPFPARNGLNRTRNRIKAFVEYFKYKANEFQIPLYDGVVVISTALERRFAGNARRIIRVPILCDVNDIDDREVPMLNPDAPFKICFAGYIKYEKEGFNILYESLSLLKQSYKPELYLYGKQEEKDRCLLNKLADKYGLRDDVYYMGNIDPGDLPDEFRKYNLLILPRPLNRRTKYGFSTKLSEYLVSGIPVLATDVSDNAMYIRDSFNGYIIPPGSASVMADKLQEIIRNYNCQADRVVKNAHNTVRESFDYKIYSKVYAEFFWPDEGGEVN